MEVAEEGSRTVNKIADHGLEYMVDSREKLDRRKNG